MIAVSHCLIIHMDRQSCRRVMLTAYRCFCLIGQMRRRSHALFFIAEIIAIVLSILTVNIFIKMIHYCLISFHPKEKYRSFTGLNTPQTRPYKIDAGIKGGEYWKYFIGKGYCELASIYQAVSKDIFVVIGMHTETKKRHIDLDATGQKMDCWLSEAGNYLIEYSIQQQSVAEASAQELTKFSSLSDLLTKSERQVAYELLRGKSNKEIARDATLTEYAVENHLRRMYRKLSVRNRTALILKLNSI